MARSEASEFKSRNAALQQRATAAASRVVELEATNDELERAVQSHDLEMELVRTETAEATLREREKWEKEMATTRARFGLLEDAALQAERERDAALRDVAAFKILLENEQAAIASRDADRKALESKVDQQHSVLADLDKINGNLRSELAATKARLRVAEDKAGRTVVSHVPSSHGICLTNPLQVEHIRVLEEAQR